VETERTGSEERVGCAGLDEDFKCAAFDLINLERINKMAWRQNERADPQNFRLPSVRKG